MTTDRLRVAVVEDDRTTREGLVTLINGTRDYHCVGAYESIEAVLRSRQSVDADVRSPRRESSRACRARWRHTAAPALPLRPGPDVDGVSRRGQGVQVHMQWRRRYLLKKTPADSTARGHPRCGIRRSADVARDRSQGGRTSSQVSARRLTPLHQSVRTGTAPPSTAGRRVRL
jgi:hypothetical protein